MNRSEMMASVKSKDTTPEMLVRQLLHGLGYRYRLHRADLPGKPDLVFPRRKKIIFVHGCFWHQHGCVFSHLPKSNVSYWTPKLERNRVRDFEHLEALRADGWRCLVLWECQLNNQERLTRRLSKFLA
jgi:DNA mismatch endonuclease (patch repair protein)